MVCYSTRSQDGSLTTDPGSISMRYVSQFSTAINEDFSFRFDKAAAGNYRVAIKFADSIRLAAPFTIPNWIISKKTEPFVVKAIPLLRVEGKVVSGSTGDAVAGATLSLRQVVDGYGRFFGQAITDENGNYWKNVPAGRLYVSVRKTPEAYVPSPEHYDQDLDESPIQKVDIAADTTLPDFKLDDACDVIVNVTDENGQPAAGAVVKVVTVAGYPDGDFRKPVQRTDANGQYTIRQVAVNDTLPIWVRTPTAICAPMVVVPEELDGPVEIKLSTEGVRFRVKGRQ